MPNENAIQQFTNEEFGVKLRVIDRNGDPWFVAKDVCGALDVNNSRQATSYLDDDEKGVISNDTLGGNQDVTIISEAGLYSLILRSRKPEAKAFKRWVTHEVLPQIRKNGNYDGKKLSLRQQAEMFLGMVSEMEAQSKRIDEVGVIATSALAKAESNYGCYTVLAWAKINGMSLDVNIAAKHGKKLSDICRGLGIAIERIRDPRFGLVNVYPEDILKDYFASIEE